MRSTSPILRPAPCARLVCDVPHVRHGHRHAEVGHLAGATGAVAYVTTGVFNRFDHRELARDILDTSPSLRTVIVAGDLLRAAFLLTIPLAWALDLLTMVQLCIVAACVGVVTVFFDVANQSYLPEIVAGNQISDGNAKLQASQQTAVGTREVEAASANLTELAQALMTLAERYRH